jgi:hypothetical protein
MHHEGEISLYANKAQKAAFAQIAGGDEKLRNNYADRVAHWQFFRFRFMARTISFAAPFNYYHVCGFPMAVIDKPIELPSGVSVQQLIGAINAGQTEVAVRLSGGGQMPIRLPTQFIGQVSTLEITADQNGGSTTGTLSFCRSHRSLAGTDDEYLNTRLAERQTSASDLNEVTFLLTLDDLIAKGNTKALEVLKNLTPQGYGLLGAFPGSGGPPPQPYTSATELDPTVGGEIGIGTYGLQGTITAIRTNGIIRSYNDNYYYDQVALVEEVVDLSGAVSLKLPPEEAIRPPWISSQYSNNEIGTKIYEPFFGTGSIVDDQTILVEEAGETPMGGEFESLGIEVPLTETPGFSEYGGLGSDVSNWAVSPSSTSRLVVDPDAPMASLVVGALTSEVRPTSIAMAIDVLALLYGMTASRGMATSKFVWNYVKRPIATLPEIFGDADLSYDEAGNAVSAVALDVGAPSGTSPLPREGFHSRALAPLSNLVGMSVDSAGVPINFQDQTRKFKSAGSRGRAEAIYPSLDQRVVRKQRVLDYVEELVKRALRG